MKQMFVGVVIALVAIVALMALVIVSGIYSVAADEQHTALVYNLLETARERSIAVRSSEISAPELKDPERVRRGAGNYDSMCVACHLAPDARETELSRGLYPEPPNLARANAIDPAEAFWAIKHGIKSTGMPAWGKSMGDEYIWDMVAFIRELPQMTAEEYASIVRSSEGHSHGGSESTDQHDQADSGEQGEGAEQKREQRKHTHESGEEHSHDH